MKSRQEGMASVVVVSILVIVMTLISIGFARLMNRALTNSANRQFSTAATYAAQSGINDVSSYLKQYVAANPGYTALPYSKNCNGASSLIGGNGAAAGPFFNDSNLAGDTSRSTQYTCILLNPTPPQIKYSQISSNSSQVVRVNTSAYPGSLDRLLVSWQATNSELVNFPPACPESGGVCTSANFPNETSWSNSKYIPMIRLTTYPIPVGGSLNNIQTNSKTVFLYPESASGTVPVLDYRNIKDGTIIPIHCTTNIGFSGGVANFVGTADYTCNLVLSKFYQFFAPPDKVDYVYLRLTPIYGQADVEIKANDEWNQALKFINVQAMVDVTAQSGGISKRLQAYVDTSSLSSTSNGVDYNISSASDQLPEQPLRTAVSLCKREVQTISFYSYVSFDDPASVCHDTSSGNVSNPIPHLDTKITGDGVTRDYTENTPSASQKGTVYIGMNHTVGLHWTTTDATACAASGSGWSGDVTGSMSFSGSPSINGTGNWTSPPLDTVRTYTLQCSRVGGGNSPYTTVYNAEGPETVTAWPPPVVYFNNTSVTAGNSYSLSWYTRNSTSCSASGSWSGSKSSSITGNTFSENQGTWPWWDNGNHDYYLTCSDPSGRTTTAKITLGPPYSPTCTPGDPTCTSKVNPPTCHASVNIVDNGDGTGYPTWNGTCPDVSPGSGYYSLSSSTDGSWNIGGYRDVSRTGVADSGNGTWLQVGSGYHCVQLEAGADPWGWQVDSSVVCKTIVPPLQITDFGSTGLWDQGPQCNSPGNWWDNRWLCRGNAKVLNPSPPDCADSWHRWTVCAIYWSTSGGGGTVTCTARTDLYGAFDSSSWPGGGINNHSRGPWGWGDAAQPSKPSFSLTCTDSYGQIAVSFRNF